MPLLHQRIFSNVLLVLALLVLPWWLWVLGALGAAVYFRNYRELILLAMLYDVLYAPRVATLPIPFLFTVSACVAYGILHLLMRYTRVYV